MNRRTRVVLSGLVVLGVAVSAYTFQKDNRSTNGGGSAYRVIPWPTDSDDGTYDRTMERRLNEMAADGWRFHSTLLGQRARLMIFERGG